MAVILASASPRRRELLEMLGVRELRVMPAHEGEEKTSSLPPEEIVCRIALGKARAVAPLCGRDDVIVAADTLVYLDGAPLGKPVSEADAARMLSALSGRGHTVYTGVAVASGEREVTRAVATNVYFRDMTPAEIAAYISTGEPMDKAGAYGAQGRGAVFIRRIEGDFFNVVGLPLCALSEILDGFGVKLA